MESQPQNPEFRINPENFHQCSLEGLWKYHTLLIRPAPISFGTREKFLFTCPDRQNISAVTRDFQQCGILTCVDSDEPVKPPFKLRNSK